VYGLDPLVSAHR